VITFYIGSGSGPEIVINSVGSRSPMVHNYSKLQFRFASAMAKSYGLGSAILPTPLWPSLHLRGKK
jgi:hypothetical protein